MKNETLSRVLRGIDVSKGHIVRTVDDLKAVLLENHKTVTTNSGYRYVGYYDYIILMKEETKAGIILKCDFEDVHVYVFPRFRNQHIVSRITGEGFLKKLWPEIETVTCANKEEYERIKHLAEIAGYSLRN